jgi:hypothetical protein
MGMSCLLDSYVIRVPQEFQLLVDIVQITFNIVP